MFRECHAKDLAGWVVKVPATRPRNVTATEEERAALIAKATPHVRCWLMLCSDLAIRSGTARKLTPASYDKQTRTLTFVTKYQNAQRLPVTDGLAEMLDGCKDPTVPFVGQMPRFWRSGRPREPLGREYSATSLALSFNTLKRKCGITRNLRPHDLRRTTATRVYEQTKDLRLVQALLGHASLTSTLWYLDHHMTPVPIATLELAKLNPTAEVIQ